MFVTSNMEVDPMINLNLDIVFPNCPCGSKCKQTKSFLTLVFFQLSLVLDFKFQTGYSTWARADMPQFRFLEIDRLTNEVKAESPLVMDMVSNDKYVHIKKQLEDGLGCRVVGEHEMYQVPSKLFFATDRDMWLIKKL